MLAPEPLTAYDWFCASKPAGATFRAPPTSVWPSNSPAGVWAVAAAADHIVKTNAAVQRGSLFRMSFQNSSWRRYSMLARRLSKGEPAGSSCSTK